MSEYDVEKSLLTPKAKYYISEYIGAKKHWLELSTIVDSNSYLNNILTNINEEMISARIIIKPCSIKKS